MGNDADTYGVEMNTDGSGEWCITLPVNVTLHDLYALSPVIREARKFLKPTVDDGGGLPPCPLVA